jgi:hypothetical protein
MFFVKGHLTEHEREIGAMGGIERGRILILETDNELEEVLLEQIALLPEHERPTCIVCKEIATALDVFSLFKMHLFAVVVDDYHLVPSDVLRFVSCVKTDPGFYGDIIAFTGNPASLPGLTAAGCGKVLPKPFTIEEFAGVFGFSHYLSSEENFH